MLFNQLFTKYCNTHYSIYTALEFPSQELNNDDYRNSPGHRIVEVPRGRPRQFDRDKALQDALLVFWRKGFYATSIPDLCGAIGVHEPSLYAAFGNKEKLYVEAVQLYMKISQSLLWGYLETGRTARAGMRDLLMATAKELSGSDTHPNGCFITLATIDEDMPEGVSRAVRGARREWLEVLRAHLNKAVANGELPASTDTESMSRFFQAIVQSIGIQSHDGASQAQLEGMVETAMAVWPKGA
jgi:AcrR family transcriptional regulator